MSETKFTPGPWHEIQSEDSDSMLIGPLDDRGIMPYCISHVESEDDAHLIAAAPEIYDALKNLLEVISWEPYADNEIIIARAALAKARGQQCT